MRMGFGVLLGCLVLLVIADASITQYINIGVLLPALLLVFVFGRNWEKNKIPHQNGANFIFLVVLFEKILTVVAISQTGNLPDNSENGSFRISVGELHECRL